MFNLKPRDEWVGWSIKARKECRDLRVALTNIPYLMFKLIRRKRQKKRWIWPLAPVRESQLKEVSGVRLEENPLINVGVVRLQEPRISVTLYTMLTVIGLLEFIARVFHTARSTIVSHLCWPYNNGVMLISPVRDTLYFCLLYRIRFFHRALWILYLAFLRIYWFFVQFRRLRALAKKNSKKF